jgi:hypothetical protein
MKKLLNFPNLNFVKKSKEILVTEVEQLAEEKHFQNIHFRELFQFREHVV